MTLTYSQNMKSGAPTREFVYYVAGMDWAACSSQAFADYIAVSTVPALNLRKQLFGSMAADSAHADTLFSAYEVQVLPVLKTPLGAQDVKYDDQKGLTVNSWSVTVQGGEVGYDNVINTNIQCFDILGLGCQPTTSTIGVGSCVMAEDYEPDPSTYTGLFKWYEGTDTQFKSYIDARLAAGKNAYFWVGSSCLVPITSVTTSGGIHSMTCRSRQFRTPNETIFRSQINDTGLVQGQTVPIGLVGQSAILYSVDFNSDTGILIDSGSDPVPWIECTGKVLTEPQENGTGGWNISNGGFTDQAKYKVNINRFKGQLAGYIFTRNTVDATNHWDANGRIQQPHIWVFESNANAGSTVSTKFAELWIGGISEGAEIKYDSIDEIKDAIIAELETARAATTIDCRYQLGVDGDLCFSPPAGSTTDWSVQILGPAAFVCGFGYIAEDQATRAGVDMAGNPNSKMPPMWSMDRSYYDSISSERKWIAESSWQTIVFGKPPYWLHLRQASDLAAANIRRVVQVGGVVNYEHQDKISVIKNRSECAYYYQEEYDARDPDDKNVRKIPDDGTGNRYLYVTPDSDTRLLEADDYITLGDAGTQVVSGYVDSVDSSAGTWMKLDGVNFSNTEIDGAMTNWGWSIQWLVNHSAEDPYALVEATAIKYTSPVPIIKQLLGDTTTDVGISRRMRCTSIMDLFGVGGERELVDWDGLEEKISQSGLDGASYSLELPDGDSGESFTINDILQAILLTHGIRAVWEPSEAQRSFRMTWTDIIGDSAALASNNGREILEADIMGTPPGGTKGGNPIYANLTLNLKNSDGVKETINVEDPVNRSQFVGKGDALVVNDILTAIPPGQFASARRTLRKRLGHYLDSFKEVHYTQSLDVGMSPLASLAVGGGAFFTASTLLNIETGYRGQVSRFGEVMAMQRHMGGKASRIVIRSSVRPKKGIGPALILDDVKSIASNVVTFQSIPTAASNNEFASVNGGLTDLATFGCWYWDSASNDIAQKTCTCDDYGVVIWETGVSQNSETAGTGYSWPYRNVWRGTIAQPTSAQIKTAGECVVTLADATNFSTVNTNNGSFAMKFTKRDSTDLQPCQTLVYGWWGDSDGLVSPASGPDELALTWG